jgi:hypothetical protein
MRSQCDDAAVLERLIDHAALFPPASMSLPEALAEDRAARDSEHAGVLNRFVAPAGLLSELPDERPALSVVLRGAGDAAVVGDVAGVEAVELRLDGPRPRPADLIATYRALEPLGVETYFELVLDGGWRDDVPAAIGSIAAVGGRVKLRCGGDTVPSIEQVALVIACCRDAGVPFKATAGLHHAVGRDGEHGFLNLLAATTAPSGGIEAVLAEEDPAELDVAAADRSLFVSFGSCSWREPVDDLVELGLLS